MDVFKQKSLPKWRRPIILAGLSFAVMVLISLAIVPSDNRHKVQRSKLLLGSVQRGDLKVTVDAYGVLRSNEQTLITARTDATVEKVLLRPGLIVEADSIILQLSNPELEQEVEAAAIEVAREQANLRRLKLANQREFLADQATLAQLSSDMKIVKLRSEAERKTLAKGATSRLEHEMSLLELEQLEERVALQKQRIEQLKKADAESIVIQQEEINQR